MQARPMVTTGQRWPPLARRAGRPQQLFIIKMEQLIEQLNRIERNTLLAAKNVLTFDDVALLTGLSKSHLYKLTSTRQIPYYKPSGKNIYFDRKEIEDWLRQNRANTEQEAQSGAAAFLAREGL